MVRHFTPPWMTKMEYLPSLLQACCWASFQVGPLGENQVHVNVNHFFFFNLKNLQACKPR